MKQTVLKRKAPLRAKPKRCREKAPGCQGSFFPRSSFQVVCSNPACAIQKVEHDKAKAAEAERKEEGRRTKQKKIDLKTRRQWLKETQIEFNKYIRARDIGKPCICCPNSPPLGPNSIGGGFDCGHYRSVGSAPHMRFIESNAHGQTKQCNRWGSGRAVDYRAGLIDRIGLEAVENIEVDCTTRQYSIADLMEIKQYYKEQARELSLHYDHTIGRM